MKRATIDVDRRLIAHSLRLTVYLTGIFLCINQSFILHALMHSAHISSHFSRHIFMRSEPINVQWMRMRVKVNILFIEIKSYKILNRGERYIYISYTVNVCVPSIFFLFYIYIYSIRTIVWIQITMQITFGCVNEKERDDGRHRERKIIFCRDTIA